MTDFAPGYSRTAYFVLESERASITLAVRGEPAYVSFTGECGGSSGQAIISIREAVAPFLADHRLAGPGAAYLVNLLAILDGWDAYHLKPFDKLTEADLQVLTNIRTDLTMIGGERFGAPGDIDDLDAAPFSNADDVIDSRDVIKRIEELEGAFEAAGLDWKRLLPEAPDYDVQGLAEDAEAFDFALELSKLKALEDEASGYAEDWRYGATLIAVSHFTDYAEQYADDIGAINADAAWPICHIDWTAAAADLKRDYTEVDFDGVAYLIR